MSQLPDDLVEDLAKLGEDIDSVVQAAAADAGANEVFTKQIVDNLVFYGKPLAVWEDELVIPIPHGKLDPDTVRELYIELANKIQKASHFYTLSNAAATIGNTGIAIKRADLISALITYYHTNNIKPPANSVLEKIAESQIKKLSNMNSLSKVVRDFWKEKLNTLDKVKSCLSNISISVATELKYAGEY